MVELLALLAGMVTGGAIGAATLLRGRGRPRSVAPPAPPRPSPPPPAPRPAPPVAASRPAPPRPGPPPVAAASAPAPAAAPVPAATGAALVLGTQRVVLGEVPATLGRGRDQTVRIDDARASRAHAVVRRRAKGGWELVDSGSANGTLLNGHRVPDGKVAPLRHGDRIGIGEVTIRYEETGR